VGLAPQPASRLIVVLGCTLRDAHLFDIFVEVKIQRFKERAEFTIGIVRIEVELHLPDGDQSLFASSVSCCRATSGGDLKIGYHFDKRFGPSAEKFARISRPCGSGMIW
jgi:hypothetical protein